MFKVSNLSKRVPGKVILNSINFEVSPGQIAVFLGGSGVGKTTLMRILNNLETYDQGTFYLNGQPFDLKLAARQHKIGMVFQHFNLFEHLSVEENITLALIKCQGMNQLEANKIAHALLERYGLAEKAKESVHKLSGGQKQRLAIARTLALNPAIVCLDEPTSALDPRLTSQVAQFIQDLAQENRIVILTTHDLGLLNQLNAELFLMEHGAIVESVNRAEFVVNPSNFPKLSEYFLHDQ